MLPPLAAWSGRQGAAGQGAAGRGKARQGEAGGARQGKARQGEAGVAWHGLAGQGRRGMARQGTAGNSGDESMKLFSDAGQRWADQDHGRWEPGDDTRADMINELAEKNATDPGFLTDVVGDGFGLSAVTATLLADYESLDVQGRATLAARLYNDIYRAVHRATEAEL